MSTFDQIYLKNDWIIFHIYSENNCLFFRIFFKINCEINFTSQLRLLIIFEIISSWLLSTWIIVCDVSRLNPHSIKYIAHKIWIIFQFYSENNCNSFVLFYKWSWSWIYNSVKIVNYFQNYINLIIINMNYCFQCFSFMSTFVKIYFSLDLDYIPIL